MSESETLVYTHVPLKVYAVCTQLFFVMSWARSHILIVRLCRVCPSWLAAGQAAAGGIRRCPAALLVSVSAPICRWVNYHLKLSRVFWKINNFGLLSLFGRMLRCAIVCTYDPCHCGYGRCLFVQHFSHNPWPPCLGACYEVIF